jgi:hypothetical protein
MADQVEKQDGGRVDGMLVALRHKLMAPVYKTFPKTKERR